MDWIGLNVAQKSNRKQSLLMLFSFVLLIVTTRDCEAKGGKGNPSALAMYCQKPIRYACPFVGSMLSN